MYKNLYDSFKHWFQDNRGQVFFYSDPHFNDGDQQYLRPNYIGDEEQVKKINAKIGKYDTLVILGDIGDTEFVKKLRGYKVLIMGNHDKGASNYYDLFNEVYEGALLIAPNIILSHEPLSFNYALNIHGHDHAKWSFQDNQHLNVCAELINYTPICLKDIVKSGVLKNINDIHRTTIDRATERKFDKSLK